jgi:hypothetical protein
MHSFEHECDGVVGLRSCRRVGVRLLRCRRARLHLGARHVDPARSLAIHTALEAGRFDRVRELVATIAKFEAMRTRYGNGANVTVVKAALNLLGLPVGRVRLPGLPELDDRDCASLAELLQEWGLSAELTAVTQPRRKSGPGAF